MPLEVRAWLVAAALHGLCGVAFGAFAAHGASDPQVKGWLQTGAQYQMIHALAALACFPVYRAGATGSGAAAWLFAAGALLFAGSLYLIAFTSERRFGMVAPIGGLLLIGGWAVLAFNAWRGVRSGL